MNSLNKHRNALYNCYVSDDYVYISLLYKIIKYFNVHCVIFFLGLNCSCALEDAALDRR